jgi:hypothetical protein
LLPLHYHHPSKVPHHQTSIELPNYLLSRPSLFLVDWALLLPDELVPINRAHPLRSPDLAAAAAAFSDAPTLRSALCQLATAAAPGLFPSIF